MVVQKEGKKEDFELPESQKYKLTLGIDREVVRRAKMQDINISFWTEQLLKIMTFEKKEITTSHEDVLHTWYKFLTEVSRMLKKYEMQAIRIGKVPLYDKEAENIVGYLECTLNANNRIFRQEYDTNDVPIWPEEMMEDIRKEYGENPPPIVIRQEGMELNNETINDLFVHGTLARPTQIIENLLHAMTHSSKVNKEKIREMNIALRILKMLSENGNNNGDKKE